MMGLHDCFSLARETFPCHEPYAYFEYGHYCYLHLRPKRRKAKLVRDEYHRIDRFTGKVSGIIHMEDLWGDPVLGAFAEKEVPVSVYGMGHPDPYARKGVLGRLRRLVNGFLSWLRERQPGQAGKYRDVVYIRRNME